MILPQGVPSQPESVSRFAERLMAGDPPRWYLPESTSRPDSSQLVFRVSYRSVAERIADLVGPRELGSVIDATTDHALLVLLGEYAQHLGLIQRLQGRHTPRPQLLQRATQHACGVQREP